MSQRNVLHVVSQLKPKQNQQTKRIQKSGFTLAELLISLAILGVIATFTIPKILTTQQNGQRIAVFKETLSTISAVLYTGYIKGDVNASVNGLYVVNNINASRICTSNSFTQGCWTQADPTAWNSWNERLQPGFILHNGASVAGLDNWPNGTAFMVDWNGINGPNIEGDDQMVLGLSSSGANAGKVAPGNATSTTLYQSIFQ